MSTKKSTKKTATTSKPKKAAPKTRKAPAAKRTAAAKPKGHPRAAGRPVTGSTIHRSYKGRDLEVLVLEGGFRFDGQDFSSLSALAKHITGYPAISGPVFFKLAAAKAEAK